MPDLLTHTALTHLIARPRELKNRNPWTVPLRVLFYTGTILPDILTRPWYILIPATHDWTVPFHTPLGALIVCGIIALMLEPGIRKKAFAFLAAGGILHFILDGFQKQITGNSVWLYPFSNKNFNYGLFWAGEIMKYIPVWIGLVVLLEIIMAVRRAQFQTAAWRSSVRRPSR